MKINTEIPKIKNASSLFFSKFPLVLKAVEDLPTASYFSYSDETNLRIISKVRNFINSDQEIKILLYKSRNPFSSAIAYREGTTIFINSRKLNSLGTLDYSANILHEICHMVGYEHPFYPTKTRKFSVPYFLGYLLSETIQLKELVDYARRTKKIS